MLCVRRRHCGTGLKYRLKRGKSSDQAQLLVRLRDQPGQLPHIVERHDRPGGAQPVVITGPAMAAAAKAEDGHTGGKRAGDAGDAVLDHKTSFG